MPDVFILGAGFSKAICSSMPTLRELGRDLVGEFPELERYAWDVELALTYLYQHHPWQTEPSALRERARFFELQERIAQRIREAEDTLGQGQPVQWEATLMRHWHNTAATVVTLNWDTLVERAAVRAATVKTASALWHVPLVRLQGRTSGLFAGEPAHSFRLLKLHGSTNWLYSGHGQFAGDQVYYVWDSKRGEPTWDEEVELLARDKVPLIIPPVADKSGFYAHDAVRTIWALAARALRSADAVYCMGYSLPWTDLETVRYLLSSSFPDSGVPLYVINMAPCVGERAELVQRYRSVCAGLPYAVDDSFVRVCPEEPIPGFVDWLTGQAGDEDAG